MSPRAAWRLERLGFSDVYDYVVGKADWLAAGLATDGGGERPARAVDVVDRSVPTCGPGEMASAAGVRASAAGWEACVVVNERGIVLGRLRLDRIDQTSDARVEDVMEPGPATVRADTNVTETLERLRARRVGDVIVTTPDGNLVGVLQAERE